VFSIEMLPAAQGDSLWIEYGPDDGPVRRILIDAGMVATYDIIRQRILDLDEDDRCFELLVITHVDSDHIEGAIPLLQDKIPGLQWGEVWFNGYRHASEFTQDKLGALQGEYLSVLIDKAGVPWNEAFGGGPIVTRENEKLPHANFSGMKLTVLSPTPERMRKLAAEWEKVLEEEGLDPNNPKKTLAKLATVKKLQPDALGQIKLEKIAEEEAKLDTTVANGSTITLLAEYEGKTALLAGDVWAPVLTAALKHLNAERNSARLELDVLKVPHHGSVRNMTRELLEQIKCKRYLFSTSGAIFDHPDDGAFARIITWGGARPKLYFNYPPQEKRLWDRESLQTRYGYRTFYPKDGETGLRVDV
jgi:beta-lactamase superfamily II metal-dependent hydrolase